MIIPVYVAYSEMNIIYTYVSSSSQIGQYILELFKSTLSLLECVGKQ